MAKQTINIGTAELAGDGETLRSAFDKVNDNFTELYNNDAADITLASFSVGAEGTPSGDGSIAYNNTTGVFTYTPPAGGGGGIGEIVQDTTPQLGGNLDMNGFEIVTTSGGHILLDPDTTGGVGIGNVTNPSTLLHLQQSAPIITLQRLNNALSQGISWTGQAGTEAAHIKLDGTGGTTNTLIMSTFDGSSVTERLRIMAASGAGIQVTGTLNGHTIPGGAGTLALTSDVTGISNVVEDTTPQLGGTLDANGNTIDMGTNVLTDTNLGQFITAYGWGNHASAGYLTSISADSINDTHIDFGTGSNQVSTADIPEQTNLYYTDARADARITNALGGNVTITGNLDVNGTTTTIDTTNTTVTYSIIELANGTSGSPSNDAGIVIERGSSDNAFIGFDESADKFVVGTGSFTGASTGNLTISTGTLLANVEGNLTGTASNATTAAGIAATAITGLTAETSQDNSDLVIIYDDSASALKKMTVGNLLTNAGAFNNFTLSADAGSNQTISDGNTLEIAGGSGITTTAGATDTVTVAVDSTVITGQGTYSGTVDTTNDFVLVYDNSTTSLKKIAVSDLNSASGAGTMSSFTIAGDSGSNQVIADANTLTLTGGSGIDTSVGGTDEVTIALNTEAVQDIVGAMFSSNTETNITATYQDSDGTIDLVSSGSVTEAFKTIAVSGQNNVVADSATDTLTFAAGANITLTTNDSTDTVTIAATGGAANAFSTFAVSGQSNVVADSTTDTMTFVAGTGMTLTTDASADSITFTSAAAGGGTMPFTAFDGSTDNIILSSASTGGALPVTLAGGTSDPINMTATTQTLTSYADDDGDTKVEVERSSDNDTVHVKAGGTDVITATSSGVTITNLTVTGTTTQANELKITDTLFELNADGGSLTTDAGLIIERGSTGDNAAFIWDESTDSFVAATTATDGSASSNLTYTEATLKAATQSQSDNSTKVATTAYVDTAVGNLSSNSIADADNDTKIQVEESSDEDIIRADTGGQERVTIDNNVSMSSRGGFFTHNLTMHSSETFTISSTEGTVAAGPLDVQGTVDVQGSLVIL